MINYRPAWAEIDLDAVRQNFSAVKNSVGPGTKILVSSNKKYFDWLSKSIKI